MLVVMAEMTHRQLPCLSVHDSVVCRVEDESVVIGLMQAVSCFYLGAVLPVDGKMTPATVTLTSELYSHEMAEASRHSVPLGIHRLQREASTLRTRTSSTGSWLILRARNRTPPPCHTWRHQPERHLRHCLFSQEANLKSQYSISKDAREPRGRECCACSFRNGRIGIARSSQPTTFQGNTRVLRELLPFSRQYQ